LEVSREAGTRPVSRTLVVCIDGTWNTAAEAATSFAQPTNVARLKDLLINDGERQYVLYLPGVGTRGFVDRMVGGVYGSGTSSRLTTAYRFICEHYREGDRIALFGFSRGAFAVRLVVGTMVNAGILRPDHLDRVDEAVALYRNPLVSMRTDKASFRRQYSTEHYAIGFIGVWDTVARYGPLLTPLRWLLARVSRRRFAFIDTKLPHRVEVACHALALGEGRSSFLPVRWSREAISRGQVIEEVWFAGSHADVGGGNRDGRLAGLSLEWMAARAAKAGLMFARMPEASADCCLAPLNDAYRSGLWRLAPVFRRVVKPEDVLHPSVFERMKRSTYVPRAEGVPPASV
jgi:uncharacterized protein (DUF2235 family)